jgi:uncharacterized ferritin-like protein (DUF455 family)
MSLSVFDRAQQCLQVCSPDEKVALTHQLACDWQQGMLDYVSDTAAEVIGEVGRPDKPELVQPRELTKRSISAEAGRVILAHALAHIEFNAINLALDAVYRFRGMPRKLYADWIKVADEEAYHFSLLNQYIQDRGHSYGDYPAHNGLWEMAQKTADDVMVRMALVPRVLEARGLDVTPGLIKKLQQFKDQPFVDILQIIHRDEIGHVAIGSHWFKTVCAQRQLDARVVFKSLIQQYMHAGLKGPFDEVARLQAGFTEQELADLNALGKY